MSLKIITNDLLLAEQVCVGDQPFADCFAAAQAGNEATAAYDAVVTSNLDLKMRIAAAFAYARQGNWLIELCTQCIKDRVVSRQFIAEAAAQTLDKGLVSLQAMVQKDSPFKHTLLHAKGLLHVTRYICRIEIDGHHAGTGLLVPPHMVITAGHVFENTELRATPLIRGGAVEPLSPNRIRVLFDDAIDIIQGRRKHLAPREFKVVDNWLLAHEAPQGATRGVVANADMQQPDYALIHLASSPAPHARPLAMDNEPLYMNDPLLIIQHPAGSPQCHDDGLVHEIVSDTHAFLHSVNSLPGSSGAPCFNTDFNVVGVHTGTVIGSAPQRNVALGIGIVAEAVSRSTAIAGYTRPYFYRCSKNIAHPIVGRESTLDWLRNSSTRDNNRILAISPAPRRGAGMSFTADIIRALLPNAEHRVVKISALQFHSHSPLSFVEFLIEACGAPPPQDLPPPDGETTAVAYLRNALVPALMRKLEKFRDGRLFWLILDDLRRPDDSHVPLSEGTGLRECLDLIYESVRGYSWLRIVLLGYDSVPPDNIRNFWTNETFEDIPLSAFIDYSNDLINRIPNLQQRDQARALVAIDDEQFRALPAASQVPVAIARARWILNQLEEAV